MALYQLLYVSAATEPSGNAALQTLVASARSYNHDHGLTGLLLYSESLFLQMLEGEEAAVHEVYYDRIAADPRHTHLRLLADGPVAGCVFPDWSIGFLDALPSELGDLVGHLHLDGPDFLAKHAPAISPVLMALCSGFVGPRTRQVRP